MSLLKTTCPKCGQSCVVDLDGIYQTCPVCGTSLVTPLEGELPPLVVPETLGSLEECLGLGFRFLYFRKYDLLGELADKMKPEYPDSYWTWMFLLISDVKIDVIFLLPKIEYELSEEEIHEDVTARFYHSARKKYSHIPQAQFNKIAGIYPDLPGETRGKWKKARTKYDEKLDEITSYCQIASKIRTIYLHELEIRAKTEDQIQINKNIKIWLDEVNHASIDLYAYDKAANEMVNEDNKNTPYPGNRPKFIIYITLYVMSLITFIFTMANIIISLVNGYSDTSYVAYIMAGIGTLLFVISLAYYLIGAKMFKRKPIISTIGVIAAVVVCASGMLSATADVAVNWYFIVLAAFSFICMLFATQRGIKYAPHKTNKNGTIIGDFNALANNAIEFDFHFDWNSYIGGERADIRYKEEWTKDE